MQKLVVSWIAALAIVAGLSGCKAVVKLLSKGGDEAVGAAVRGSDEALESATRTAKTVEGAAEEGSLAADVTQEAVLTGADLAAQATGDEEEDE